MSDRNRSRVGLMVGICLALAVGFWLRSGPGFGSASHRRQASLARRALARHSVAIRPAAVAEARAAAIRETMASLRDECAKAAGGDWDRWSAQLAPMRSGLAARVQAAQPFNPKATGSFEGRSIVLAGRGDFPLFEPAPDVYLMHVLRPASLDPLRESRPVTAAARWLERKGIDLIFVPVPKMTESHPEPFVEPCPSDRIIAPHVRRAIFELLEDEVEVVDVLPAFLRERDPGADPLYQPADPHWAPRGQAIAARMVADRLSRYEFVARAKESPRFCEWATAPYLKVEDGTAFPALNPEQQRLARAAQPKTQPSANRCIRPIHDATSPVVCIGDSYNAGFLELLAREINLPVHNLTGGGNTSHAFKGMVRDPSLLEHARVVVWLLCDSSLKGPWPMPPSVRNGQ